jgi:hypothetical protein
VPRQQSHDHVEGWAARLKQVGEAQAPAVHRYEVSGACSE